MKKLLLGLAVATLICLTATSLYAANQVTVQSRSFGTNSTNCPIRVFIENDDILNGLSVPLILRDVTPGAFISDLKMSFADRLPRGGPLNEIRITNILPDQDGTCSPNAFLTVSSNDTLSHPVVSSPEGAIFAAIRLFSSDLLAGADTEGSLVLTVTTTGTPGTFEIDTVCIDPGNHLEYRRTPDGQPVFPDFTKGTITIVDNARPVALCANVQVSADNGCEAYGSIDNGSFDPDGDAITLTQIPPGPYPLGANIVRLYVEDENFGRDSCEAVVTVVDDTPPVIVCHPDTIVIINYGEPGATLEFASSAVDNCGDVSIECSPPSGSFFPLGITTVTCTATDGVGNTSECTFYAAVLPPGGYCNYKAEDINCDGAMDAVDLNHLINVIFFNAPLNGACCFTEEAPE